MKRTGTVCMRLALLAGLGVLLGGVARPHGAGEACDAGERTAHAAQRDPHTRQTPDQHSRNEPEAPR